MSFRQDFNQANSKAKTLENLGEELKLLDSIEESQLEEQALPLDVKREALRAELKRFIRTDQPQKVAQFKVDLSSKVKEIDKTIADSLKRVNSDSLSAANTVLDEYKKIELYLYNTINDLAQTYLLCKRDDLKLALALRFRQFTNYHLADSLALAEKIVTSLSVQITSKEKNKISFELIAREIDKELYANGNGNHFKEILLAIKQECFKFTERTEYLFTSYLDARKREYGNRLKPSALDDLFDQDNASQRLQSQVLDYLLKNVDSKKFYLTFVNLGIEGMHAKIRDKNDNHSWHDYNLHQQKVLNELKSELDNVYDRFFTETKVHPIVKAKLNHTEIKKIFFQFQTRGYMKHEAEPVYQLGNKLTASQVLTELENDFENQKLPSAAQANLRDYSLFNRSQRHQPAAEITHLTGLTPQM